MPDVEELADLYGVDPGAFVAARDALARRLRATGDTESAAEVKALRRPPKTAWALNSLARTEPALIEAVINSATSLAHAFDGESDVRSAQSAYREAIHDAVTAAADRAGIAGEALRSRMRDTLFAAGADPAVAQALVAGVLRDDHEAPGFGLGPTVHAAPPSAHPSVRTDAPAARSADQRPAQHASRSTAAQRLAAPARRARAEAAPEGAEREGVDAAPAGRSELERRADLRRQRELDGEADRLRRKADRLRRDAEDAAVRAVEARREAEAAEAAAAAKEGEAAAFRDQQT